MKKLSFAAKFATQPKRLNMKIFVNMSEGLEKKLLRKFLSLSAKLIRRIPLCTAVNMKIGSVRSVSLSMLTIMEKQLKAPADMFTICSRKQKRRLLSKKRYWKKKRQKLKA